MYGRANFDLLQLRVLHHHSVLTCDDIAPQTEEQQRRITGKTP